MRNGMKTRSSTVAMLVAAVVSHAEGGIDSQRPIVTAIVQVHIGELPPAALYCAEQLASRMFTEAGVRLQWRLGPPNAHREEQPIVIDITSDPPAAVLQGALAYARVFEGVHIQVFWGRLGAAAQRGTTPALLAHVLVHEITHILQGTDYHSQEGVMKAHWTPKDIRQMPVKPLSFDRFDVELIHLGLAARSKNGSP